MVFMNRNLENIEKVRAAIRGKKMTRREISEETKINPMTVWHILTYYIKDVKKEKKYGSAKKALIVFYWI